MTLPALAVTLGNSDWQLWSWLAPVTVTGTALVCAGMIRLLRPLLRRYALAKPNVRSSHQTPTPQGGGIAVIAVTLGTAALLAVSIDGVTAGFKSDLLGIVVATLLLAFVGVADDISAIPVVSRLLFQAIAIALVISTLPADLSIISFVPVWLERAILFVGMLWFVNLVNFMDGIDWMTVAEIVPVAAGLSLLGFLGVLPAHAVFVALTLLGAMLGFAPFNRPVARIFLGDVGSLPIGLLLGWLLILLAGQGHIAAAFLLPLYYLADATITLLRRLVNGEKLWKAHRTHFYQRATDNGYLVPDIVRRVFAVNIGLMALAVITVWFNSPLVSFAALMLGGLAVGRLLVKFARRRS
jgi:UDP-N-acetylmuramyl pentapeptide phosphotransferase/UDP-N-acetylglucosamine-1-phosphate transferase